MSRSQITIEAATIEREQSKKTKDTKANLGKNDLSKDTKGNERPLHEERARPKLRSEHD